MFNFISQVKLPRHEHAAHQVHTLHSTHVRTSLISNTLICQHTHCACPDVAERSTIGCPCNQWRLISSDSRSPPPPVTVTPRPRVWGDKGANPQPTKRQKTPRIHRKERALCGGFKSRISFISPFIYLDVNQGGL